MHIKKHEGDNRYKRTKAKRNDKSEFDKMI